MYQSNNEHEGQIHTRYTILHTLDLLPNGKVGDVVPSTTLNCCRHEFTRLWVEQAYPVLFSTLPQAEIPPSFRLDAPMHSCTLFSPWYLIHTRNNIVHVFIYSHFIVFIRVNTTLD